MAIVRFRHKGLERFFLKGAHLEFSQDTLLVCA
jgi:hypothetical protein